MHLPHFQNILSAQSAPRKITLRGQVARYLKINMNVVFIEDNEGLRLLFEFKAKRLGWSVHTFDNGKTAYDWLLLHKDDVDILLIDLMVFGMTGWEILYYCPTIPSIVISARQREADIKRAFGFPQVIDYVTKPFKISLLIHVIEKAYAETRSSGLAQL